MFVRSNTCRVDKRKVAESVGASITHPAVKLLATGVVAVFVGLLAGHVFWTVEKQVTRTKLLPPDTPPAEYLYLDPQRVLAYLGQIRGGLTEKEKRVASETQQVSGSVKGLIGDVDASEQSQTSVEQVVTPAATDRFFSLLVELRNGREQQNGRDSPWLKSVNLDTTGPKNTAATVDETLKSVQVGDFLRVTHAHLVLPRYAAVAPKVRYAALVLPPYSPDAPRVRYDAATHGPALTPVSVRQRRRVNAYLRRLGANPPLPFIVWARKGGQVDPEVPTFFVPATYAGLLDNDRLLASDVTIVGKVIYENPNVLDGSECVEQPYSGCTYVDRQTVTTFAPALKKAQKSVLARLRISAGGAGTSVRRSVTFKAPMLVVLPVAIYE
jgi:hypothetical protein